MTSSLAATRWAACLLAVLALALGAATSGHPDGAKVTAIVKTVTFRPSSSATWRNAKVGTKLATGTRVRTAARSKCEIKFPGGSLVRMPPRCDLVITSVKTNHIKLLSGKVLAQAVKGSGVRVAGARATASVQGTWVEFDGGELSVWDGTANLETSAGVVQVDDQQKATVREVSAPLWVAGDVEAGSVSSQAAGADLLVTFRAGPDWSLLETDVYVGATAPADSDPAAFPYHHTDLGGVTADEHSIPVADVGLAADSTIYIAAHALLTHAGQAAPQSAWGQGVQLADGGMYFIFEPTVLDDTFPWEFPTGRLHPWWRGLRPGSQMGATPGTTLGEELRAANFTAHQGIRDALHRPSTKGDLSVIVTSAGAAAPSAGGLNILPFTGIAALGAGLAEEADLERLGKKFFGPQSQLDAIGLLFEGGGLGALRARAWGIYDNLYLEVGGLATSDFSGESDVKLSEGFAVWRNGQVDLTAGRQHYLTGPINNNSVGTLFGPLTFDGARLHYEGDSLLADLAWVEGYDRDFDDPGEGAGWLGRLGTPIAGGQLAVNVYRENGVGTGYSADLSLPVVSGVLDAYAEIGVDPWDRHLETWGVYLPWLYDETGVDLFAEYARRHGEPSVWSGTAYRTLVDDWSMVGGVRKADGEDVELLIGVVKRFGGPKD